MCVGGGSICEWMCTCVWGLDNLNLELQAPNTSSGNQTLVLLEELLLMTEPFPMATFVLLSDLWETFPIYYLGHTYSCRALSRIWEALGEKKDYDKTILYEKKVKSIKKRSFLNFSNNLSSRHCPQISKCNILKWVC